MSLAVYVYFDGSNLQQKIDSDDYAYAGSWAAATPYYAASLDVVDYGDARYVAIRDNTNFAPLRRPPRGQNEVWSILSKIQEGDEPPWPAPPQTEVALETAWAGTALAQLAYDTGTVALYMAWQGTQDARVANDLAYLALQTAWIGTSAAGVDLAIQALETAWMGTATANTAIETAWAATAAGSNYVQKSGDTMTGNLVVPQVIIGYGTVPYSAAAAGTIQYDFNGPGYQHTTIEGALHISVKNMTAGAEIAVPVTFNGSFQVGFPGQWTWYTEPPTELNGAGETIFAFAAFGTDMVDVRAAHATR